MKTPLFTLLTLLIFQADAIRPKPAEPQVAPETFINATIHTGEGDVLKNAMLVIESGQITYLGDYQQTQTKGQVTDLKQQHIYPGFILTNTNLGLTEVDAVNASIDFKETGELNPNVRTAIAYNADSMRIPPMRFNGILLAQVVPVGGLVSGTSSVMQLDAWNWNDALIQNNDGLHVNWPAQRTKKFDYATFSMKLEKDKNYTDKVTKIKTLFKDAQAGHSPDNIKLNAVSAVFNGDKQVYIHANTPKAIIESIEFMQSIGIQKPVLVTDSAALPVIDFIISAEVPVIVSSVHDLPQRTDSPVEQPYAVAVKLQQAGVLTAVTYPGSMSARNLGFTAGTTVAQGLDKNTALKMITFNPAKILKIDDRYGSLAVDKSATFFISSGDALDMSGQQLKAAYIDGRKIDLNGKQQKLYHRYHDKYQLTE
ncbi:imidazolonepropionase [Marinicella pacifica]|uniref:Imidazolonepropionase n=1 Tax=Marinicella pacifica TaxID=1171543 RepID=A0A917CM02_9GAMM|nr:amidohydrolase family protein [Marinicella pacifica]GGF91677.1 imidazolonepropionase [Marinicella pacifica]